MKQHVENCWRKINGEYKFLPVCYTEEWNVSECQQMAQKIISEINFGSTAIVAVLNNAVIGFALLGNFLFVMKSNILICQILCYGNFS